MMNDDANADDGDGDGDGGDDDDNDDDELFCINWSMPGDTYISQ